MIVKVRAVVLAALLAATAVGLAGDRGRWPVVIHIEGQSVVFSAAGPVWADPEPGRVRPVTEPADRSGARLASAIEVAIGRAVPDQQVTAVAEAPVAARTFLFLIGPPGAARVLSVTVTGVSPAMYQRAGRDACRAVPRCAIRRGPHGSVVRIAGNGDAATRVTVVSRDGTRIDLNADSAFTVGYGGAGPPLTTDQLVAIGSDPALTMYP